MANVYNKPIVVVGGGVGGATAPVDNGPIYEGKYRVRYFDVDGTILKIEYVANGGKTTPPDAPAYDPDHLIFDEWNYDTANYIVEQPTDIGATYKTVDDLTYIWCRFTAKTGLNPTVAITGFTYIDWGDGTVDTNTSHTYANEGNYLIKISGDFTFTTSAYTDLFNSTQKSSAIEKIYLKSNFGTLLPEYCFANLQGLNYISLPKNISTIPEGCFVNGYNLKFFVVPRNANFNKTTFRDCRTIRGVVLNTKITELYTDCFSNCYGLQFLIIPVNTVAIKNTVFRANYNLNELIIPKKLTSIGTQVGTDCTPRNIFIFAESVISIGSTFNNSFYGYEIMWVNDSIIEQLKVATNWSKNATIMKPLSWYPSLTDPNA
jgi:hypothetical protein